MNTLEHTIVRITKAPFKNITEELCCWEVHAIVDCYGGESEEVFRYTTKSSANIIKPGYTYLA